MQLNLLYWQKRGLTTSCSYTKKYCSLFQIRGWAPWGCNPTSTVLSDIRPFVRVFKTQVLHIINKHMYQYTHVLHMYQYTHVLHMYQYTNVLHMYQYTHVLHMYQYTHVLHIINKHMCYICINTHMCRICINTHMCRICINTHMC